MIYNAVFIFIYGFKIKEIIIIILDIQEFFIINVNILSVNNAQIIKKDYVKHIIK